MQESMSLKSVLESLRKETPSILKVLVLLMDSLFLTTLLDLSVSLLISTISQLKLNIKMVSRLLNNLKRPSMLLNTRLLPLISILIWPSIILIIWMSTIFTVMTSLIHLLLIISSTQNSDKNCLTFNHRHSLNAITLFMHVSLLISWMETPSIRLSTSLVKDSLFQSSMEILTLSYLTLVLKTGFQFLTGAVLRDTIMPPQSPGQRMVLSLVLKRPSKTSITDSFSNLVTWFLKINQLLL